VVAAATGAASGHHRASRTEVMVAVLAVGQIAGHAAMATSTHQHGHALDVSWQSMMLAHVVAVVAGATLMALADRLCCAVSRVLRVCVPPARSPVDGAGPSPLWADRQVPQSFSMFSSISHRGPPALACQ
jgi:hypothetical protein